MKAAYLEDFRPRELMDADAEDADAKIEDQKLQVFEEGYSAGWDDAIAAQAKHTNIATEVFVQNLRDLSFTYQEALTQMSQDLARFMDVLCNILMPKTLDTTFVETVRQQLTDVALESAAGQVEIKCSKARLVLLQENLSEDLPMPVIVSEDQQLDTDEVSLSLGPNEQVCDISSILRETVEKIEAYSDTVTQVKSHEVR